jgi:hydroxymethylpyrimidine/phosphomethylpyrimidine kinase
MIPRVLTIAGSDSSGGAGIQADLKTFAVFRVYGMSAITALTAQNTTGVRGVQAVPGEFVREQIDSVATDIGIDAAKAGMLANREIIEAVAAAVRDHRIRPLVVDPVIVAQSGAILLQEDARSALLKILSPLAALLTPNVPEAESLLNRSVRGLDDMRDAALRLAETGAKAVLVKGGHLKGPESIDVLYDGGEFHELPAKRIRSSHTHGTGCMLSAAIAAGLAQRLSLLDAVRRAKRFISTAIEGSLALGKGNGPANPLAWLDSMEKS